VNWDYAAGFLDADGCIGFVSEYGSPRLRLSATQVTREVLEELQELIGHGKIYTRPSKRPGNLNTDREIFSYQTGGYKILPALAELETRMIVKRAKCTEMIDFAISKNRWTR